LIINKDKLKNKLEDQNSRYELELEEIKNKNNDTINK
jgi:hypothetical protein